MEDKIVQMSCGDPHAYTWGLGKIHRALNRALGRLGWLQQPPSPMDELTQEEQMEEDVYYEYEHGNLVDDVQEIVTRLLGSDYIIMKKEE